MLASYGGIVKRFTTTMHYIMIGDSTEDGALVH